MPRSPSEPTDPLAAFPSTGSSATITLVVTEADTAIALGSGDVAVIATPRLVALCEEASMRALDGHLPSAKTSVASRVRFDHLAPVGVGGTVSAEATLERVEGRRLVFTVTVRLQSPARSTLVAAGRITRVVVDRKTFLAKTSHGTD